MAYFRSGRVVVQLILGLAKFVSDYFGGAEFVSADVGDRRVFPGKKMIQISDTKVQIRRIPDGDVCFISFSDPF